MLKEGVQQNVQVAIPVNHPLKDKTEDRFPTRSRSRSAFPTRFTKLGQLRICLALPTGDGENMSRFPYRLSWTIFIRAIRFHQLLEPPSHCKGNWIDRLIKNFSWFLAVERRDLRKRNQLGSPLISTECRRPRCLVRRERKEFRLVERFDH